MKQRIAFLVKNFLKHELISGSFYLFVGTTIGNILAFLFNLFLVRNLSYASYAEITALISLITLTSIPAQAFLPTIVQFASTYFARNEKEKTLDLFHHASLFLFAISIILIICFFIFSLPFSQFLHLKNPLEIVIVGIVVATIYLSIANTAFLQSLLKFQLLATTIVLGGILKLIVGIGLIIAGFGIFGILWGYFLTFFVPYIITFYPLRYLLFSRGNRPSTIHMGEILKYALPATITIFSLSSFTSTDILLVKHFFTSSNAALYSGLSLIGRVIFYFTAPIATVMFPLVVKRVQKGESSQKLLYFSLLLVLIPSICLTLFYFFFPTIAVQIFLGKKYFAIVSYLGWFGLYLTVFSLLNVLINFFLSLKRTAVVWIAAIGATVQAIGITLFHHNITQVVMISLILSLVLLLLLLLYYFNTYGKKSK